MKVFYISPTGSGSHSGSSAANAGTIYDLPKFVAAAAAGDEVRLLADKGAYNVTKQITIAAGGGAGAPITIRGAASDGTAMAATIVGTRATGWKPGLAEGVELFRLMDGSDHLKFADLATKNIGNGVFRIAGDLADVTIKRVTATNVTRFIEDLASGSATTASVNGLLVEDVTVTGYSRNAIHLKYNSSNVTLHNVVGDSQKQNGGLIVSGVALDGTVHNVVMDHVTMRNNYGRGAAGDYWNGDGFVAERGTYNLTFRDTVATGNTDAGYDIKANNVTMTRASASGNTKNFRLWGGESVTVTDSVSKDPYWFGGIGKASHFQAPSGANVTLNNFRYSDSSTVEVFDLSNGNNAVRLVGMALPSVSDIHFGNNSRIQLPTGLVMHGTSAADTMAGGTGDDMLIGGAGNDVYTVNKSGDRPVEEGAEGIDLVMTSLSSYTLGSHLDKLSYTGTGNFSGTGNNLNNTLTGGEGNDWLNGGTGDDVLSGGEGGDTYWFGLGGRHDTINNGDTAGVDSLKFGSGIAADDLWFAQNGSDLLVTVRGTGGTDAVRVKGWYSSTANRLGKFQLSNGEVLEATNVQKLVQAMADFSTSSGTPTSLSGSEQQTVETVIAANWKSA
ncbi:MAG TPA: calcium-binding protein [Dongiaceae bacterium]|nr:calcium-binding protein [Dongiaceae bacterium]